MDEQLRAAAHILIYFCAWLRAEYDFFIITVLSNQSITRASRGASKIFEEVTWQLNFW